MSLTQPGTDVMAPWGDGFLYSAVVVRLDPDDPAEVLVAFWEGPSQTVPVKDLRPLVFEPGTKVFVDHLAENDYQPGTIRQRIGGAIQVEMKNGSLVWTSWAKARIKLKR
jgi:hypothetical protein